MSVTSFQLFILAPIVIACAAYVLWPILRGRPGAAGADSAPLEDAARTLNLSIVRERRAQLDTELAGLEPGSAERERRILEFTEAANSDLGIDAPEADLTPSPSTKRATGPAGATSPLRTVVATLIGLTLLAGPLLMYRLSGTPEWIEVAANLPKGASGDVEGLVSELERRLQAEPGRADGWLLLGRTRLSMGNIDAARVAMEKALEVDSDDPALAAAIRADLADLLAQAAGTRLDGRPWALIQQALARDPRHQKALALAGAYQVTQGNKVAALGYWEPLLALLPEGSEQAKQVRSMIDDLQSGRLARGAGADDAPPGAPTAAAPTVAGDTVLRGRIVLDPALTASVAAQDTLFVVARSLGADGKPAGPPVAVLRTQASALPLDFALSDADAMSPAARLSGQQQVAIVARISRAGTAAPAAGDLEGRSDTVAANATGVEVRIDRVVR